MKCYPNPKLMLFVLALSLGLLAVAPGRFTKMRVAVAARGGAAAQACTMNPVVTPTPTPTPTFTPTPTPMPTLSCATSSFAAAANIGAGDFPTSVTTGDFNADGKLDLATANQSSDNVSVLLGNGTGGFAAKTNFSVGVGPQSVTTGDFNADGKLDLATANLFTDNVSVLLGNGMGGFAAKTNFSVGDAPFSVTTGDFNRDGKLDLAAANSVTDNVSVLLGNGTGGFAAASNFGAGDLPFSVTTGDFNEDGKLDLATGNVLSANVSVLLGNGMGGFAAAASFGAGNSRNSVTTGDFNADGNLDLAMANPFSDNVSVVLGNGMGGFAAATNFRAGDFSASVTTGDFNADGKLDLATANSISDNVSILLNDCTGNIAPVVTPVTPAAICSGAATNIALASAPGGASFSWTIGTVTGVVNGQSAGNGTAIAQTLTGSGSVTYVVTPTLNGRPGAPVNIVQTVNASTVITTPPAAQTRTVGQSVTFSVAATGTNLSYQWRKGGANISGATSNSYPINSVIPSDAGNYDVVVTGTCGTLTSSAATLTVNCQMITVTNPVVATGTAGTMFSQTFTQTGGIGTTAFSTTSALPTGLTLATNGTLSGTPMQAGTFNLVVKATDANGCTGTQSYTLSVNVAPTISALAVTRQQTGPSANLQIATANDAEDAAQSLLIQLSSDGSTFGNAATSNGVTVTLTDQNAGATGSNPNAMGQVFADIVAGCGATNANFTLRVTDNLGAMTTTTLTVAVPSEQQAPTLVCPSNQVGVTNLSAPTAPVAVTWPAPLVSDNCAGATSTCTPPSGTTFPLGTTTVTCTATDAAGNMSASCSFTVTVRQPRAASKDLIAKVRALVPGTLTTAQANGLMGHLELANTNLERGQTAQACTHLQNFVNAVNALTMPTGPLANMQAQSLLDYANKIRAASSCPNQARAETVALFNGASGAFHLQHQLTAEQAAWMAQYSQAGDVPVAGDWDGDGVDTLGVFRHGVFHLRHNNHLGEEREQARKGGELVIEFGLPGDVPVIGDWDGDGTDTIGVFRAGLFLLRNTNTAGAPDVTLYFGQWGDVPLAGDWDGDGQDSIGVYHAPTGTFQLRNALATDAAEIVVQWGGADYLPVVGDWDGDGVTTIGLYGPGGQVLLRNTNTAGPPEIILTLDPTGGLPVVGKWEGQP